MKIRHLLTLALLMPTVALAVPLDSSVLLFHRVDYQQCPERVERARAAGSTRVMFVPTIYFHGDFDTSRIDEYCHAQGGTPDCRAFDAAVLADLRADLSRCFARASALGMDIAVLPHLDSLTGQWRNDLSFDPTARKGAAPYSYQEVIIDPAVAAFRDTAPPTARLDFALAGEMGASVFGFAAAYLRIMNDIAALGDPRIRVGVNLNHDVIAGKKPSYSRAQLADVATLLERSAFVGISAYAPLGHAADLRPAHFEANVRTFTAELRALGLNLAPDKELQFSEVGLGGGDESQDGNPARTPREAADAPYAPVNGPYDPKRDPWKRPAFHAFRVRFHEALLDYLALPRARNPITAAYLWSGGSFDPQNIYPGSDGYADEGIAGLIRVRNASAVK